MGPVSKSVATLDENLASQIAHICQLSSGSCGLVIGQALGDGRFNVVHLIRACVESDTKVVTSSTAEENDNFILVSEDDKENHFLSPEKPADDGQVWKLKSTRRFCPFGDIRDLSQARLAHLSVQVSRLVPGGLAVIGVFLTSSEPVAKPWRPKLKETLHEISTKLKKDCAAIYKTRDTDEMLILALDPRSKQINTSLYLDAADAKSIIKPLSTQFAKLDFLELQTRFKIDLEKPTELKKDVEQVLKHIVRNFEDTIDKSVCLVGEKLLDDGEIIATPKDRQVKVVILVPFEPISYEGFPEEKSLLVGNGRLAFAGDVVGRAYVSVGSAVSFAVKAVKDDLLRSMTTRAEMHCEDFLVTDADEQDYDVVHELPRRILASLPNSNLKFSNYLSEGEELRDSLEVFVNLLDFPEDLNTSDLIADVENSPNQDAVDSALESVSTHSGEVENVQLDESVAGRMLSGENPEKGHADRPRWTAVVFAGLFAVLFAGYQLYLLVGSGVKQKNISEERISLQGNLPSAEL